MYKRNKRRGYRKPKRKGLRNKNFGRKSHPLNKTRVSRGGIQN